MDRTPSLQRGATPIAWDSGIDIRRQFHRDGTTLPVTAASSVIVELGPAVSRPITTSQWPAQTGF